MLPSRRAGNNVPRRNFCAIFKRRGRDARVSIGPATIPLGYYVKSMRYGDLDLLRSPFTPTTTQRPHRIDVVLTKTPPAGSSPGITLRGRLNSIPVVPGEALPGQLLLSSEILLGKPNSMSLQSSQIDSNGLRSLFVGKTTIEHDGSFEIKSVPPGTYTVFAPNDPGRQLLRLDVADRDIIDVQIPPVEPGTTSSLMITSLPPGASILASPPNESEASPLTPPTGGAILR